MKSEINQEQQRIRDKIRGSLIGGAAGDALGYAIEFEHEGRIFRCFGEKGITEYQLDRASGKALISDDTQMTLFTAAGLLLGETRLQMRGVGGIPRGYIRRTYLDWLNTQKLSFKEGSALPDDKRFSWLMDVPELYSCRAPGNTCLSALEDIRRGVSYEHAHNHSKGCGGVMRVAPLGLRTLYTNIEDVDKEGAAAAEMTHGHSLGYMPAAVLVHIVNRMTYTDMPLKDAVLEARDTVAKLYAADPYLPELTEIINLAVELAENEDTDLNNIHRLGEGWVGEEALAIAIYCSLKYENDFSAGIIAAVNHNGDSDSTGAVTGNILGAICGYAQMEAKWKENLELLDVLLEMADDLAQGCLMEECGDYEDEAWTQKYIYLRRYSGTDAGETAEL